MAQSPQEDKIVALLESIDERLAALLDQAQVLGITGSIERTELRENRAETKQDRAEIKRKRDAT